MQAGDLREGEVEPLGLLVAAVGARRRHDGAEEQDEAGGGDVELAEQAEVPAVTTGATGSSWPARWCRTTAVASSTIESRKWAITKPGLQLEQHGQAAEHDLADHAGDEAEREPDEVAAAGHPEQRAEHGEDDERPTPGR